ncbi:hypothetical protein CTAYLR_004940 [Chrysophaeum taylorii]|uniref:Acyl-coenzyme A thioesterase THEM4 n=1 Tax=Chrysophaeum taylorii TaxID=2483200 RepID=A0AAD7UR60_9STRA|nr:hypothetical protein CTAYLR_004940 [Chrysophaeum taylorii]
MSWVRHGARRVAQPLVLFGGGCAWCMSVEAWREQPLDAAAEAAVAQFKESSEWVRIDSLAARGVLVTLGAETNALKTYRIYARRDGSEVAAVTSFGGESCTGHPGIVHGGCTALLFDTTFGFANAVSNGLLEETNPESLKFGFTAALHVNYRSPCVSTSTVLITCKSSEADGRKRHLRGDMRDAETGALVADATALFILPKKTTTKERWWGLF